MRWMALVLVLVGAAQAEPVWRVTPDPGPAPIHSPRVNTLWFKTPVGWQSVAKVIDVTPDGRAWVTSERELVVGGAVVDHSVLSGVVSGPHGVAYAKSVNAPSSDVWRVVRGKPVRVTSDGRSDRPFFLPDGRMLWVSGTGGVAGFVLEGRRLTNQGRYQVPVPARPRGMRWADGAVEYDAGDGWWRLDVQSGKAVCR